MTRLVVGAVALLFALAGCGGDDPKAEPSSTPSTPVTTPASTTPSPPVMPEGAKANTKAGAIAFVRHYVELINHAQATGDIDSLAAAESDQCRSCENARKALAEVYEPGGHIEGGALKARIDSAAPRPDMNAWTVFAAVSFGPQTVVRPSGSTTLEGGKTVMTLVARYRAGQWSVLQWSRSS